MNLMGFSINFSAIPLWLIGAGIAFCVVMATLDTILARRSRYKDLQDHPDDPKPKRR